MAHHTGKGNFRRAAGHQQTLAELYEQDMGDEKKAMKAYETAAQWFDEENAEAYVYISQNSFSSRKLVLDIKSSNER